MEQIGGKTSALSKCFSLGESLIPPGWQLYFEVILNHLGDLNKGLVKSLSYLIFSEAHFRAEVWLDDGVPDLENEGVFEEAC